MRAALYARVSTKDKGQDWENQAAQIRTWATQNGHEIIAEYSDTVSGSGKVRRPQFEQMLEDAKSRKFDMLLFWSLDRLSREGVYETLMHLRKLDEAGVCWRSHTEAYLDSCGAFKDAVLAILAAIAKQERLRISERVKAGLEVAKSRGKRSGRPRVERDPELLRKIQELHAQDWSVYQIGREVGISKSQVHRILQT